MQTARTISALLALALASTVAAAQPGRTGLGAGTSLDEGFTRISGVRELSDGRLLVADAREMRMVVVDWARRRVQDIGREGRGPGEYRTVNRLHALGGDSTLAEDSRNGRWLVLDGARIVGSVEYGARRLRDLPAASGADAAGRVLATEPFRLRPVSGNLDIDERGRADSLFVVLERLRLDRVDTVARIRGPYRGLREARRPVVPGGAPVTHILRNPLAVEEQALLFPDGWIALALLEPYRVDWITPQGRRVRGAPLPFVAIPVTEREKLAAVRADKGPAFTIADMPPDWPAVLPPFQNYALLRAPDGHVAIRRTRSVAARTTIYDVVDRTGRLVRSVEVPLTDHIVGFGARAVYVVTTDSDDVQHLRRHAWP